MSHNSLQGGIEITVILEAARQISDSETVIAGSGLPLYVAAYALQLFTPRLSLVLDGGLIDPISHLRLGSVSDSEVNCLRFTTMSEILLNLVLSGRVQCGIIGAAQIDHWGNINSSYVNGQHEMIKRLPGAGGASVIAANVQRLIVVMPHELRRFPYQCSYISSVGNIRKRTLRGKITEQNRTPEFLIVTNLCVLKQNHDSGSFEVTRILHGITFNEIQRNTGFSLKLADDVSIMQLPSLEEENVVRTIKRKLDNPAK